MRVGVVAPMRHPLAEPYAGGLEVHTAELTRRLRDLGHDVAVFGPAGSDPDLVAVDDVLDGLPVGESGIRDVSAAPAWFMAQHHAYLALMLRLRDEAAGRFDVLHDNASHYLTLALGELVEVPIVATLHTPPTPWVASAVAAAPRLRATFRAVSTSNAASWEPVLGAVPVIHNGVDTTTFRPGCGGGPPVWTGRLVAEKGADHAVRAARRAGTGLVLAGPISDPAWFEACIAPHLGGDVVYAGHLARRDVAALLGDASVVVVTPRWDEPYGLVVAEALACGTPVAGYDRGAVGEILDRATGRLAPADDVPALARAIGEAVTLDRAAARRRAVERWSSQRMAESYARLYASLADKAPALHAVSAERAS